MVVKYDYIEEGENQGLRVLEIQTGSPALAAGLIPFKDYLVGSGDIIIRDGNDLTELVSTHVGSELSLSVYNADTETVREVILTPKRGWGGEGLLGCGIGTGVLHRIPMARRSTRVPDLGEDLVSPTVATEPAPTQNNATLPVSPQEPISSPQVILSPQEPPIATSPKERKLVERPSSEESVIIVKPRGYIDDDSASEAFHPEDGSASMQ